VCFKGRVRVFPLGAPSKLAVFEGYVCVCYKGVCVCYKGVGEYIRRGVCVCRHLLEGCVCVCSCISV